LGVQRLVICEVLVLDVGRQGGLDWGWVSATLGGASGGRQNVEVKPEGNGTTSTYFDQGGCCKRNCSSEQEPNPRKRDSTKFASQPLAGSDSPICPSTSVRVYPQPTAALRLVERVLDPVPSAHLAHGDSLDIRLRPRMVSRRMGSAAHLNGRAEECPRGFSPIPVVLDISAMIRQLRAWLDAP
jgi:hypothetical protein